MSILHKKIVLIREICVLFYSIEPNSSFDEIDR